MSVDLALAKSHIRVTHDIEDTLIAQYLAAAVAWVENYTGKKLTRGTVTQEADAFGVYLPLFWGLNPVDLTITYTDTDDAEQTVTNAKIVRDRAYPALTWPAVATNSVIVLEYTAGYDDVPADLDSAVLLLVGEYFANREAGDAAPSIAMAVEALCRPYRALRV